MVCKNFFGTYNAWQRQWMWIVVYFCLKFEFIQFIYIVLLNVYLKNTVCAWYRLITFTHNNISFINCTYVEPQLLEVLFFTSIFYVVCLDAHTFHHHDNNNNIISVMYINACGRVVMFHQVHVNCSFVLRLYRSFYFLMVTLATSISDMKTLFGLPPTDIKLSYFRNPWAPTSMVTRSTVSLSSSISFTKLAYFLTFHNFTSLKLVSKIITLLAPSRWRT